MIIYELTSGDPYTQKINYRPRTCFLMTQLGGSVAREVTDIGRDLKDVLKTYNFDLITATSSTTGKDILDKIWQMIVAVPLAVAIVHKRMRQKTLWNVYYEIGVAQALGKETMIIRGPGASVASDLVRTEYINYDAEFKEELGQFLDHVVNTRAPYYEEMSKLMEADPHLAMDFLRRSFLISEQRACRNKARKIRGRLPPSDRARNSVENMLAEF
jgi:hypothetical protein